jgi:hypothetical protein
LKRHAGERARGKTKQKVGSLHLEGWLNGLETPDPKSGCGRHRAAPLAEKHSSAEGYLTKSIRTPTKIITIAKMSVSVRF